ncbi:DICT sensory domain-containing protein [Lyngbya sp. PCC 8106]|uniref:DICT sensory domain-containing protein n=1 Tax=Lyngbya sp. (strain PCC 8106) TaxID=313612 RepID=UPI0000EA9E4A|nr:DICT sensory domain-containing protein [Lyngbya sp. PCC 8106]EAW39053.1 GAF Sensor Signal Transduction Histidine Kinase [Lyngbya sp. PCC 8106]
MSNPNSLLDNLLPNSTRTDLQIQDYFKSSLTALSHAIEDLVLARSDQPLVIANFQQERFYRQEIRRYRQIAQQSDQVYILAVPEVSSNVSVNTEPYEIIPLKPDDQLAQEWHLVIVAADYTACLICREQLEAGYIVDQARRFQGLWTFDPQVSRSAARWLLDYIVADSPQLKPKVEQAYQQYQLTSEKSESVSLQSQQAINAEIFATRLVTYLQTNQYKLLKAYRAIAEKERRERLINVMATAIRSSLNSSEIFSIAVQEIGETFENCRCLLYRLSPRVREAEIEYEFLPSGMVSLKGESWSLIDNPLFVAVQSQDRALAVDDVSKNSYLLENELLRTKIEKANIRAWLLVPIRYQGTLLGMIELHYGGLKAYHWRVQDIALLEAIATQIGVALTQAQAYANLISLNEQLEALERIQNNLIAIVGHELRTPLSTIQVCLESLASEPDMPIEFRQTMLDMALTDSERLRRLIQDILTLSKLESGQTSKRPEPLQLQEVVEFALAGLRTIWGSQGLPTIKIELSPQLPCVRADGEGLVEVLTKLLDNACKFTGAGGQVTIQARIMPPMVNQQRPRHSLPMLEVVVADTGRGIEPNQLETIFDRFYQEEDSLKRSVGGTGLGLAICRQIVQGMGGQIWAISAGRDRGSQFHFTVPVELSIGEKGRGERARKPKRA